MTVRQRNPLTFDKRKWNELATRLILSYLDENEDWGRDSRILLQRESGIADEHFALADQTAWITASAYKTPESRERARAGLYCYLEKLI